MPVAIARPTIPAGHFIPLTTIRYEDATPIKTPVMIQVIVMIKFFMVSSLYTCFATYGLDNYYYSFYCQPYILQYVIPVGVGQSVFRWHRYFITTANP